MIYTFTPSPAIDYYVHLDNFKAGQINRVSEYSFTEAGKGINCSEMLSTFGIPSVASYFSAGFTGRYIDDALREYPLISSVPIQTEGITRVNIKFVGEQDTAINATGRPITGEAKQHLRDLLCTLTPEDLIIISGSLPDGLSVKELLEFCHVINRQQARLVLDVPVLKEEDLRDLDVYLIKPNLEEFAAFTGKMITEADYRQQVQEVVSRANIRNVLLSLGSDGSYYAGEHGCYRVKVPQTTVFSPVGAGDCTLAAFVGTLYTTGDIEQALRTGNAAGSARVKYGKLADRQKVMEVISEIELIKE